jgi:glycosyltransferase involved in cell wall biosynthesis
MNIAHYFPTTRLTEGGTVRAAIDLCAVLARRGHNVTWLTCDDTDVPNEWKSDDANTPTVKHLGAFLKAGKRLTNEQLSLVSKAIYEIDVVHIHAMWDPSNPQIAKVCDSNKTPWVLSVHGMLDDWSMSQRGFKKQIYLNTVGRRMVRNAAAFHTTAEEERRQASRWLKHNNVSVIPCIVDLDAYQEIPSPNEAIDTFGASDKPTILFLSRVHEKKSIETLIDAAAILKNKGLPVRVFIAGTGEQSYVDSLRLRATEKCVEEDVTLLGMVVGNLKLSLYALADIFALPTQQENFGLVYAEAMLCETPTIGTKGTDIWRELEEAGAIIANRTPEAFAAAIEELSTDTPNLSALGKRGREYMLRWLNTDTVASQYEIMYQDSINER